MRTLPSIGTTPGHALSYSVPWPKDDNERGLFFDAVALLKPDPFYVRAFQRWKGILESRCVVIAEVTLGGALAVGLGEASPLEIGLTLHKTYGMPLIPGSAIKGACLRTASALSEIAKSTAYTLFGTQESAGYAVFHDAWLVPQQAPLQRDVITVHHPDYYQGKSDWPTDFDDPVPVPFVSVARSQKFLFAIELPGAGDTWKSFIENLLQHTLTQTGLGAKTSSGYGWFEPWLAPPAIVWESAYVKRVVPASRASRPFLRLFQGDERVDLDDYDRTWGLLPGSFLVKQNQEIAIRVTLRREGEQLIPTSVERR